MKPRLLELVDKTSTAESVYAEKYQWLMRWALHFCGGDREMAEDLVQDTFVRMLSSWESIRDVEHPERFLYTYLKYGFLRLRSADRRQSFQSIEDGFDLLDLSAPPSGPGLLEWQQEIRAVVGFLCSRKTTAKSASLLLFRYFHGMFPAEIMLIARLSRKAVDDGLASSKLETRTHIGQGSASLSDSSKRRLHPAPKLVLPASRAVLSAEEFMRQMLQVVYAASDGDCLSHAALCERYSDRSGAVIDCWLLSHIVSCARCLDIVTDLLKLPPRGTRPLDDVLGYAPKADSGRRWAKAAPLSAAMRSLAGAKERYRATFEDKPRSIVLIVNGERIASRDVSSSLNRLTVDLRAADAAELIEVVSEDAMLLVVPVLSVPPNAAPVQQFKAELSGGRSVTLSVEFNPIGVRLHVVYRDPLFLESLLSDVRSGMRSSGAVRDVDETDAVSVESLGPGLLDRLPRWLRRPFAPRMKFAMAFAVLCIIAVPLWLQHLKPQPATMLARAIEASAKRPVEGIQQQRIRIGTQGSSFERTLHTDLARRLRARQDPVPADQLQTQAKLASAHVEWDDPLSPAGFRDWREEQPTASDSSFVQNGQLLTLTTKVSAGTVREESLTLNANTLHTVGRTVRFSDDQQIQIAELDYSIIPLTKSDPAWFEPTSIPSNVDKANPAPRLKLPPREASLPTQDELDVAELSTRLAMVELRADGQERLTIARGPSDILVEGLVASDDRKQEIERRLRMVPHAGTSIKTFAQFDASAATEVAPSSLGMSSSTEAVSPLDALSAERRLTAAQASALHASLFEAAIQLRQSATELSRLDGRFPPEALTDKAAALRTTLAKLYAARLNAAATKEQRALEALGAAAEPSPNSSGEPVPELALANAQLCFELISQQNATPRPAQSILQDLAASAAALQRASGPLAPPS